MAGDLAKLLSRIGRRRPTEKLAALVVASRGVWTGAERERIRRRLRGLARQVAVVSDVEAALLGALGDEPGVLVLAGTGSIVLGHDARGRWARAGGLGPLLGDEGSGFWLGREWLRARGDVTAARRLVQSPDAVARIAAVARVVVRRARRGDSRARAIAREGQRHLAAGAAEVARRLALDTPVAVSWAGSVMGDPWFRRGVARALARAGVRARWRPPRDEPAVAAARLAARLAAASAGRNRPHARLRR
jgi:N-acetylglucosamine kinase-like BadF-type ATPase